MCAKEIAVGVYASAAAHVVSTVRLYVGLYVIQYTYSQWISWVFMVSIIMISSTI